MTTTPTATPADSPDTSQQSADDRDAQQRLRQQGPMPRHIAIIMDGDRRWAKERGLKITEGHRHGRESVRDIVRASGQLEIEALTLYTFSSENWNRPRLEIEALMHWLEESLRDETPELHANNVRLCASGRIDGLPGKVQRALAAALEETSGNTGLRLNLALNYGGRGEIVDACKALARRVRAGELDPESIDEAAVDAAMYTAGLPDPDLLIRCSGEMRLSNFLPWQLVYTEIYFTPVFWPDFRRNDLYEAVRAFQQRQRRFGT
jgi:undecaprenyl diphosphate synthase